MKRTLSMIALLFAAGLGTASSVAQGRLDSWEGFYTGRAQHSTGDTLVEVDIFQAYEGQALYIDFAVRRPSAEAVLGAVSGARDMTQNQFKFVFTGGNRQRGRGTFTRKGGSAILHLEPTGNPAASTSRDLFGDYELVRKEPKGRTDRHPWSLGRASPKSSK